MVDDDLIQQSTQPRPRNPDGFSLLVLAFAFAWVVIVTLSFGYGSWFVGEFSFIESGEYPPGIVWLLLAIVLALLLLFPLAALGILWKVPRYRAVFQTWAIAAGYIALLAPAQFPAYTAEQPIRVLRIVLHVVFIVLLLGLAAIKRRRNPHQTITQPANFRSIWPALLIAPFVIPGWLLWGAAGSALDVFLGLAQGLLLGLAVGLLLGQFLLPVLGQTSNGSGWDITLGGFVSGTVLLMMSTGISLRGIHVQLMWVLPALGWLLIALSLWGTVKAPKQNWPGVAALIGIAASTVFIFVDPDELTLVLNLLTRDAFFWANRAAWLGAVSAWLIGIILFLL